MRVLVCGGRSFKDRELLFDTLSEVNSTRGPITCLIEGEAQGADLLARSWASENLIPIELYKAQWGLYGQSAGPRRNKTMLEKGKPDLVIAFPMGGPGTRDMVRQAIDAKIPVDIIGAL
jgi:hypothetical protein